MSPSIVLHDIKLYRTGQHPSTPNIRHVNDMTDRIQNDETGSIQDRAIKKLIPKLQRPTELIDSNVQHDAINCTCRHTCIPEPTMPQSRTMNDIQMVQVTGECQRHGALDAHTKPYPERSMLTDTCNTWPPLLITTCQLPAHTGTPRRTTPTLMTCTPPCTVSVDTCISIDDCYGICNQLACPPMFATCSSGRHIRCTLVPADVSQRICNHLTPVTYIADGTPRCPSRPMRAHVQVYHESTGNDSSSEVHA
jgi:hypothetical protein